MHRRRTATVAALLVSSALAGLVYLGIAIADDPAATGPVDAPATLLSTAVAAGTHVRIEGPHGPIHVWIPASYHADTGATILYVHGYYDNADTAWTGHQLPEQFALSALNALFIVPEAPVAQRTPVNYPDLGELIRIVEERTGAVRGATLTAAVGHSGAFRTLQTWLDEPMLDQLVMVDAMYGEEDLILDWFNASLRHRLITVGQDTVLGTESVAAKIANTMIIDRFPPSWETWPPSTKFARHVYVRAQYGHMPLVMEGIVLPSLLRLLPVELLPDEPWRLPLGSLPPLPDAPPGDAAAD